MKIVKSTILKKVKSKYGNFDFIPDDGFALRTYIDHISKLIVVEESPIKKPSGVPYTPKQFIVDPKRGAVLSFTEYQAYFDYTAQEIFSEDGKLKLEYQRKHDNDTARDYLQEKLIEVDSGRVISSGKGVAFHADRIKNALERYYDNEARKKVRAAKTAAQLTLDQHFARCKARLRKPAFILEYHDAKHLYRLGYIDNKYVLWQAKNAPAKLREAEFTAVKRYQSIDAFWKEFTKDDKWYVHYSPTKQKAKAEHIMAKYIIGAANKIRKAGDFTQKEYRQLLTWENHVYSDTIRKSEYKQYCSNCGACVPISARYPKRICGPCFHLVTDKKGRPLTFYNTELLGSGCQGYYTDVDPLEKYDSDLCYINSSEFYAAEAKFGGIVIQKKE